VGSTSGTVLLDASTAIKGVYAGRIPNATCQLREDFTGGDNLYISLYLRLNALPSSNA
jgi:hypothetical protein